MRNVRLANDLRIEFAIHRESGVEDLTIAEDIAVRIPSAGDESITLPCTFSLKDGHTLDILVLGEDLREGEYRVVVSYKKFRAERDPQMEGFELDDGLFRVVRYSSEVGGVASSPNVKVQQMRLIGVVSRSRDGVDGESPYIGDNGNWYLGSNDTGVQAQLVGIYNSDEMQEQLLAYGIQYDASDTTLSCVRIGNSSLHVTLPVQSKLRGCLVSDDGEVLEYLPEDDWSAATLDGSAGQVMVEMPEYYCKFVTLGSLRQVWLSLQPLSGYHKVGKAYYGAFEATISRTTNKLASVVNLTTEYRGADNDSSKDGSVMSGLGKCATELTRGEFRAAARSRKAGSTEWNIDLYALRRSLFWLAAVEYGRINLQVDVDSSLSDSGFRLGGLGAGLTTLSSGLWAAMLSRRPIVGCGVTNSLGNYSGECICDACYSSTMSVSVAANRYRGVELPFGHCSKFVDGVSLAKLGAGDESQMGVYLCDDVSQLSSSLGDGYECRAQLAAGDSASYIAAISFGADGDIIPATSSLEGSATEYYGDKFDVESADQGVVMAVCYGGDAGVSGAAGLLNFDATMSESDTSMSVGTRLTFVPQS